VRKKDVSHQPFCNLQLNNILNGKGATISGQRRGGRKAEWNIQGQEEICRGLSQNERPQILTSGRMNASEMTMAEKEKRVKKS